MCIPEGFKCYIITGMRVCKGSQQARFSNAMSDAAFRSLRPTQPKHEEQEA